MEINWEQTEKQNIAWGYLLDQVTTELIFGGGAGGAKSFLGCAWLIIMCGQYPETRWLMGRKKLKRLKETTLNTFFQVCKAWGIKRDLDYKYNVVDGVIAFSNGSEILLKDLDYFPSDPNYDSLGSLEITGAFIDEVNQITFKCWEIVCSRVRYRLDEYGLVPKVLGTCNPSKGWVYTYFYKPFKDKILEIGKAFVRALAKDNPFISRHYLNQLKKIKDKATRERLLNGNWEYDDDPACLFDLDVINDLFTNEVQGEVLFISGDVARKGRDNMLIGLWRGLQLLEVVLIPYEIKKSTKKSAKWIMAYARKKRVRFSHIVLDEDGVGGGVVDNIAGCVGFINNSSPILSDKEKRKKERGEYYVNYGNLKTQCYFKLAELAEDGKIGINADAFSENDKTKFVEDLGQVKQRDVDKDGKIYLIGKDKVKENIGRSPDFGDMVMMRMIFEVKMKRKPDILIV